MKAPVGQGSLLAVFTILVPLAWTSRLLCKGSINLQSMNA